MQDTREIASQAAGQALEEPARSSWRGLGQRALQAARARDLGYVLPFLGFVLALTFAPVVLRAGWPMNHEALTWKYRLLTYAAHFRRFDLLPIWSESAALGLGAPAPVLYHKLFYVIAALFYLLTHSVKAAVVAALGTFSVLGLLGLRALLHGLGVPRRAALVAAGALLFCNYAYTDWVVRGAFAEYSAMMLLPWLFWWLEGVLGGETPRPLARSGAVIFPALYLAHAALFFFAAAPVLAVVVWRLARGQDRTAFARALLTVGGAFALFAVPIVLCQVLVVRELSFAEGIAIYAPRDYFESLDRLVSGAQYVWGNSWQGLSVQLDTPIVALALTALACILRFEIAGRWGGRGGALLGWAGRGQRGYIAAWIAVLYFAFLLSPVSAPLYAAVPGFSALQFPWRLLSFVSVLGLTLAAFPLLLLASRGVKDLSGECAWLLLAVSYASSPWLHEIRYPWLTASELEAPLSATARLQVGGFEYHPRVEGVPGPRLVEHLNALKPAPDAQAWNAADYSVERIDAPQFEKGKRRYLIRAARASSVVLPIAYSPFIHLEQVTDAAARPLSAYRTPADPRIHFDVSGGDLDVRVRFPTIFSLCADVVSGVTRP